MRILMLLMALIILTTIKAQTLTEIQQRVSELQDSISLLQERLKVEKTKLITVTQNKSNIVTATRMAGYLMAEPSMLSTKIMALPALTDVVVIDVSGDGWFSVQCGEYAGHVTSFLLKMTPELEALQTARKEDVRIKAQQTAERAEKERAEAIIKKYGETIGRTIIEKKVWVGMLPEQARLSWGNPKSINRTTSVNRVTEQWVYGLGDYLYFTDGILTNIQTSR